MLTTGTIGAAGTVTVLDTLDIGLKEAQNVAAEPEGHAARISPPREMNGLPTTTLLDKGDTCTEDAEDHMHLVDGAAAKLNS